MRLAIQCATGMRSYGRWFNPEIRAAVRNKNLREIMPSLNGSSNSKKSQFAKENPHHQAHTRKHTFERHRHNNFKKRIPPSQHSPTCPPPS